MKSYLISMIPSNVKWSRQCIVALILIKWISVEGSILVDTPAEFSYKNLEPYGITGESRTELFFAIQACQDARVALYPYDPSIDGDTMYEIVFGGYSNMRHTIRLRRNENIANETEIAGLLSCTEYNDFWISWKNYYVIGGAGHTVGKHKVVEYKDTRPNPYIVNYIGISTWYGVAGKWNFRTDTPTFSSVTPSFVYATRGDTIVLHCTSVGIPVPTVTWHREGVNTSDLQERYNTTINGYLTIHNYDDDDSGVYRCKATNKEGEISHYINVHCCDCCFWCEYNSTDSSQEEIDLKLQNIKETLYVDRKETALSKRRKISAADPRHSSMIVGMTCGVSVICTMIALLVCPDLLSLLRYIFILLSRKEKSY